MKILLVAPVQPFKIMDRVKFFEYNFPFYGVNILATILRGRSHFVKVIEPLNYCLYTNNEYINLAQQVEEEVKNYDVLGISNLASALNRHCLEIARIGKKYNKKVIVGGVHPTIAETHLLTNWSDLIDVLVLGEGEEVLPEILSYFEKDNNNLSDIQGIAFVNNGKIVINPRKRRINLDTLPYVDYAHYILPHWHPRTVAINTTRGCIFKCSFCSSSFMWGEVRRRSVRHVMGEIKNLCAAVKPDKIYINDDTFISDREGIRLLQEIKQLRVDNGYDFELLLRTRFDRVDKDFFSLYKEAGGKIVEVGLETSQRLRRTVLNKDIVLENMMENLDYIRKIDLKIYIFIILGLPDETIEDIREIWRILKSIDPDGVRATILHLYPNTALWELAKKNNKIRDDQRMNENKDFFIYVQENQLRQVKLWQKLITDTFNRIDMTRELYREQFTSMWHFGIEEMQSSQKLLEI